MYSDSLPNAHWACWARWAHLARWAHWARQNLLTKRKERGCARKASENHGGPLKFQNRSSGRGQASVMTLEIELRPQHLNLSAFGEPAESTGGPICGLVK